MRNRHRSAFTFTARYYFGSVFLALIVAGVSMSQTTTESRTEGDSSAKNAIALFESGDFAGSVKELKILTRNHPSVISWHYLGLSQEKLGKRGDARKAHEKAVKFGESVLDLALFSQQDVAKTTEVPQIITADLRLAAASAKSYVELKPGISKSDLEKWNEKFEYLRDLASLSSGKSPTRIYSVKDVDKKARILSKPEPQYTEEARKKGVTGTVILRAILGSDGKVHAVVSIHRLRYGLTQKAIQAARGIRFVPATAHDESVSQWIRIEYNFYVY
jgi:TonB family protein